MTKKPQNISELARQRGIKPAVVHNRMASGWSLEKALNTPVRLRKAGRRKKAEVEQPVVEKKVDLNAVDNRLQYEAVVAELEAATNFNDALMERVRKRDRHIKGLMVALSALTALVVALWFVQYL